MEKSKTLVIGASPNPERYSYMATNMLQEYGHQVYPFGIKNGMIENTPIQTNWPTAQNIDTISLYLGPAAQKNYYQAILSLQPRRIIFNPGTENTELEELATKNGIQCQEACTLVLIRTGQY